jgi:glycosyltransferase involved in cell wall biosynthesis
LAEAFGCALPIIASRMGSLAELIEHGKTGLLFEPGSSEDLARQIQFAHANPHAMRVMGENARRVYEANYTPERNYQLLMSIYDTALGSARQEAQVSYGLR